MKNITKLLGLLLLFSAFAMTVSAPVQAKKDFTVSTSSKPYKNKYVKNPVYNKYTKH